MKLAPDTVYQYLYNRQLIDQEAVVKGQFIVHPVKTRNNIMKIIVGRNNSLFVKQTEGDMVSKTLFQREISAYDLIKNNAEFSSIARIVPEMIDYDDQNHVIITRLVYDAKNLCEYYGHTKNFDTEIARGQARILAACHIVPAGKTNIAAFPKALPWVLQLDKFNADQFFVGNKASTDIIKLIQENYLLQQELVNLSKSWQFTHLIHGDIKWINFLAAESDGVLTQTLIDWELADIGDPMWDVAGLLQSYITTWVLGFDNSNPQQHQLPAFMKHYELQNMQPSARAFLEEYFKVQQFDSYELPSFYIKALQLTAARIIQTSVEAITYNTAVEANNMRCIQLAFNILKDPEAALEQLFTIKLQQHYV